jgi:hypothetical protein
MSVGRCASHLAVAVYQVAHVAEFDATARAEGQWSTGSDGIMKRHGVGTYKSGDNEYVGEWKDDAMDGQGKFTFASGAVYEVSPSQRLPTDGAAAPAAANRDACCAWQGAWANNQFMGEGKYEWADKTSYTGGWADNKCASFCVLLPRSMLPPHELHPLTSRLPLLPSLTGCTATGHMLTASVRSMRGRSLTVTVPSS